MNTPTQLQRKAAAVKLLILDVDGVLTDGALLYGANGEEVKRFNAKDGFGIRMAQFMEIQVAVITARKSPALARRLKDLSIDHFYQGHDNKIDAYTDLIEKLGISHQEVAYVGDDVLDLPIMKLVGLPIAVADAHFYAQKHALLVTQLPGGHGAVREVCDFLIGSRADLVDSYERFLSLEVSSPKMETL